MKVRAINSGRWALNGVAAAAMCLAAGSSWALGLGRLSVQSALGETLRAEIEISSISAEEAASLQVRIASPDAYRVAGVDYNAVLPGTQAVVLRRADGHSVLKLTSDRAVQEPFVDVILEMNWANGRLVREYTLLFDPPISRNQAAPAATVAPTLSAAPVAPPVAPPPPPPAGEPMRPIARVPLIAPPVSKPAIEAAPKPVKPAPAPQVSEGRAPAPEKSGVNEVRVRPGDTLSRIAARTQRPGISLDQMLVALYRTNPQAFIDNNMNRLKADVNLTVPSAEAAGQTSAADAHEVIQAQSADFGAYRQKLAGAVVATKVDEPARKAAGKVKADVQDRKQGAASTPDKLTLSHGGAKASVAEAQLSKETERKAAAARVAELSHNVQDLKKLQDAAKVAAVPPAPAPKAALPVVTVASSPVSLPPAKPASVAPSAVESRPAMGLPVAASVPPMPPSAASHAAPAASKPALRVQPKPVAEPGFFDFLTENPLLLGLLGVLGLGGAGYGAYRYKQKNRKDGSETSFLESRLQPDSFFGASGGQRIDTRDAGGASSSMSYSLSQLDAIGDVDPVAEADVYLAYGRDLQAEEILKEALRSTPDRMAIRIKLLEVYAKRRDVKGFEVLATAVHGMTRGEGEDWAKAQEMGRQIDPENPLYQEGGRPPVEEVSAEQYDPTDVPTTPQEPVPQAPTPVQQPDDAGFDLDLSGDDGRDTGPLTQTLPTDVSEPDLPSLDDLSALAPPAPAPAPADPGEPLAFDLDGISLELDAPEPVPPAPAAADLDLSADLPDAVDTADADPLLRKLELAEEFRQIGDSEGARDLLQEVIDNANGALKARAQALLANLG